MDLEEMGFRRLLGTPDNTIWLKRIDEELAVKVVLAGGAWQAIAEWGSMAGAMDHVFGGRADNIEDAFRDLHQCLGHHAQRYERMARELGQVLSHA